MVDQSDQSLIHAFLWPATSSGVVELNKVKDMVRLLAYENF